MADIYDTTGRWLAPGDGNEPLPPTPEHRCIHGALCPACRRESAVKIPAELSDSVAPERRDNLKRTSVDFNNTSVADVLEYARANFIVRLEGAEDVTEGDDVLNDIEALDRIISDFQTALQVVSEAGGDAVRLLEAQTENPHQD